MTFTRDSLVWWFAILASVIGYLTSAEKPPTEWTYNEWLQSLSFVVGVVSGKLAASPLKLSYAGQAAFARGESRRDIPAPQDPPVNPPSV